MQTSTFYHIYNHANGNENLFREEDNYRFFLERWNKYIEPIAETYAYCLMPNHFHFLIRIHEHSTVLENLRSIEKSRNKEHLSGLIDLSGVLSQQFSNLFNSYSKAYNKMYDRRGSLFIRPFKRKKIHSDAYLSQVIFYIHNNPVHHGFTKHLEEWEHCSYHELIGKNVTLLKRKEVRNWFGSILELKKFHHQAINNLRKMDLNLHEQ